MPGTNTFLMILYVLVDDFCKSRAVIPGNCIIKESHSGKIPVSPPQLNRFSTRGCSRA